MEGGREGRRQGGRERGREGGREGDREGGREGGPFYELVWVRETEEEGCISESAGESVVIPIYVHCS